MYHAGLQAAHKAVYIDMPVYMYGSGIAFIILLYLKLYIQVNYLVA
jgi:hypothetical protein